MTNCRIVMAVVLAAASLMLSGCAPEKTPAQGGAPEARAEKKIESVADVTEARSVEEILREKDGAQLVEGFGEIVTSLNYDPDYPDYRGSHETWMEISRGPDGGQELVWRTAAPLQKKKTIFVFTGANGEDEGDIELSVNGNKVLTFSSGVGENRTWREGEHNLDYIHKAHVSGYSGLYFLTVPASAVNAGTPCEIKVRHINGRHNAWFRIKGYRDTIAFERLAVDQQGS